MKVRPNYLHEALESDKNARRSSNERRAFSDETDAANKTKSRQSDASVNKDEPKFANLLEEPIEKTQKPEQPREKSGEDEHDDKKKEKKHSTNDKKSKETSSAGVKTEKYEPVVSRERFSGNGGNNGNSGGGNNHGGFGSGENVQQANLSDNFAARSILHIADLERLVLTVRSQAALNGEREITLQLRRSVLEGLRVKIVTDRNAKVKLEFIAASENARAQVEKHSGELANILRGRGINLQSLTTKLDSDKNNSAAAENKLSAEISPPLNPEKAINSDDENTFGDSSERFSDEKNYRA